MSKGVLPMIPSRSFMVSGLTFRPLIHFEFIVVYNVRKYSNLIFLQVAVVCTYMCVCIHTMEYHSAIRYIDRYINR